MSILNPKHNDEQVADAVRLFHEPPISEHKWEQPTSRLYFMDEMHGIEAPKTNKNWDFVHNCPIIRLKF